MSNRGREYVEDHDGVHLMGAVGGGEHTLCGIAFDAYASGDRETKFKPATATNGLSNVRSGDPTLPRRSH